jgi:hypothetical protein
VSIWSDEEIRILDATYPHHGAYGVRQELRKAGYERSIDSIYRIAKQRRTRKIIKRTRKPAPRKAPEIDISPMRSITPDSIELVHWFAERGFPPHGIAKEINRPVEAIHKALGMEPPAIDREPWWPRRDDMILGRAIA